MHFNNKMKIHKEKIEKELKEKWEESISIAKTELQIANAELARQKCQNNVYKNHTTKVLKTREENLHLKEMDIEKKEEMVETTLRRLRALECFNEKQMEKFIKDENINISRAESHNKTPKKYMRKTPKSEKFIKLNSP